MNSGHFISHLLLPASLLAQQRDGISDTDAGAYRVVCVLAKLEPNQPLWQRLADAYSAAAQTLDSPTGTHHSALRPSNDSPFFGSTEQFPLASALAGGVHLPDDPIWDLVATIVAAPHFRAALRQQPPSGRPSEALVVWLRNAHKENRLGLMRHALAGAATPHEITDLSLSGLPPDVSKLRQRLIDAARSYLSSSDDDIGSAPDSDESTGPLIVRELSPPSSDPMDEGLAPEDSGRVELSVPTAIDVDQVISGATLHAARVGTAIAHAHLPLEIGRATPEEVQQATEAITERLSRTPDVGAMGLGLAMVTGCSLLDLALAPIHHEPEKAVAELDRFACTFLRQGQRTLALCRVPRPPQAYARPPSEEFRFKPRASCVVYEIPTILSDSLPANASSLASWHPRFEPATRAFAEQLRQATLGRQHIGRMRRALCTPLFAATRDECTVQLVLPGARLVAGAGSYYSAIVLGRAFDLHRNAAQTLFPYAYSSRPPMVEELAHHVIGSEVALPLPDLAADIASFRKRVDSAVRGRRTPEMMATALNSLALYTSALLHLTTGHRPRLNGIGTWNSFSEGLDWVSVSDKCFSARTRQRIFPLPAVVTSQLNIYRRSVQVAAVELEKSNKQAARLLLRSLAPDQHALCLIETDTAAWTIRTAEAREWQNELPSWSVPANAHRHVLVQELQSLGLARELISYLLGHAEPGQELFVQTCTQAPEAALSRCRPALDDYARTLDIGTTRGLRPYASSSRPHMRGSARSRPIAERAA